ncbi:hypothetical protein M2447_000528 [Ereboglobus sp. PH5-10]|uniref:hypothetical protein n=1 Tax=Ereboglobus sp. PH5-10 TaxID=2940629 RepID=UPI0024056393|nr:hypothetical protein [Ereboglobus sp. PH5-10]MDF9826447.1 hypothetical protein [Ereboglobus sp. PH5-10]
MSGTANQAGQTAETKPKFDFPTWLPPMLVKELRQGLRTRAFVLSLIGLHTALVLAFGWALVMQIFDRSAGLNMANNFFWMLTFVILVFVMPLRALGGLRSEIDARNIDLLMLTQLTSWRIVFGKWTSLVTQTALLLVTLLPYGVIRYFFGSVDLIQDMVTFAWLFAFSSMATALLLWVSGLHRFLRVLLVVVVLIIFNGMLGSSFFGMLRYGFGGSRGMFSGLHAGPVAIQLCLLFDMAIFLVFCLVQAVRRIAPPSENHSMATRLISLAPLLPLPLLMLMRHASRGVRDAMEMQSVLALVVFMLVCVLELASMELPMAVQVRQLYGKGGAVRRFLARIFLPGWSSAAQFTFAGLCLFGALVLASAFPDEFRQARFLRVLALVWVAVVTPAALLSLFLRRVRIFPLIIYGLIQSGIGLLCIFAAFVIHETQASGNISRTIDNLFRVMPVTGFWFELGYMTRRHGDWSTMVTGLQFLVFVAAACFAWWCSRPFFQALKSGVQSIKPEPEKDDDK